MKSISTYLMMTFGWILTTCLTVNADGPAVPYRDFAAGQMTSLVTDPNTGSGHFEFAGTGKGSQIGYFSITGGHDFDAAGNVVGSFTQVTPSGAALSGIYFGESFPIGGSLFQFEVTVLWTDGTRRLTGVTGELHTTAILDVETGALEYESEGIWIYP